MSSERECFVYIVLAPRTEFVTAGRFRVTQTRDGVPLGQFVYGRSYLQRKDAVEFDPVELRLASRTYETVRIAVFSARSAIPCQITGDAASSRSTAAALSSKNLTT